jgi:hypothetical protein
MHYALQESERMIAVVSEDYLQSIYATPEWATVFAQDPTGIQQRLIPVKVRECIPDGLLKTIVWINLSCLTEGHARTELLDGVKRERSKPQHSPVFPGERVVLQKPHFPSQGADNDIYIPKLKKVKTDLEISDFIESAFSNIRQYFIEAGNALMKTHPETVIKISNISDTKFVCEAFIHGNSEARCQIWLEHSYQHQIGYHEGPAFWGSNTSYNEILSISDNQCELGMQSMMRFGWDHQMKELDFTHLSARNAAQYLWRRFTSKLES